MCWSLSVPLSKHCIARWRGFYGFGAELILSAKFILRSFSPELAIGTVCSYIVAQETVNDFRNSCPRENRCADEKASSGNPCRDGAFPLRCDPAAAGAHGRREGAAIRHPGSQRRNPSRHGRGALWLSRIVQD